MRYGGLLFRSDTIVGTHDAPIRCVEYCPEVNVMVTGSWDMSVRLWDPRTPCNAGTFTQPEKVDVGRWQRCVSGCEGAAFDGGECVSGVHAVCGRGSSHRGDGGTARAGVGFEEHGIRATETRIQPEISDTLYTSFSKQTGETNFILTSKHMFMF